MGKPEIRFNGYTDDWEQRKVMEVAPLQRGFDLPSTSMKPGKYPVVMSNGIGGYHFEYKVKGPGVVTGRSGTIGKLHYIEEDYWPHNTTLWVTDFKDNNQKFIYYLYQGLDLNRFGTGSGVPTLNRNDVHDAMVSVPSKNEQEKISSYLTTLDHLITLHQRKCDEVKKLKKYMLQKMFPQNDKKVPEIRFEGFTDDWEQRKLGDWGDFYYGRSCPKWSVTEDATIPCIRYGELYTKFGAKIDRVYSYTNMPPENLRFSKGTEVLIPRVGEDPMDYNHCTWLSMPDVAIGEMISVFNTDNNPLFTATMFNATLQNEFAMRVEGGSVTNLYFEKLKNIEVSFPSILEQEKIAAYFESLDHLITLHQRKLEELKNVKKYMLQKMFV